MKQMKTIFQLAENVSLESGGLRTVLVNLDNYINENKKYRSIVVTNKKEQADSYFEFPSNKLRLWNYSEGLKKHLNYEISNSDIFHLHGVFMHIQYLSSRLAHRNNHPYIVTPHGMLEPWLLKDKKIKKKIYFELILKNILSKSNVLHAITPLEKESLYQLTKHKNIVEIPNFIYHESIPKFQKYNPEDEYLLFVGRIHPKKGLDILLESFFNMENKKLKLKIVGNNNDYSNKLKKKCIELGIDKRVKFLGGVFSDKKYELFANSKAFIAPSYSEAIGMVNLEAAICKTPVITTFQTGLNTDWNKNGGQLIQPNTIDLTKSLNEIAGWTIEERNSRGEMLCDYVINNYSWEQKGYLWNDLYNSLL